MIFDKNQIHTDESFASRPEYVSVDVINERMQETVDKKLAFTRDAANGKWLRREDAEKLIIQMHTLVNQVVKDQDA